jgi:hypothetical protein
MGGVARQLGASLSSKKGFFCGWKIFRGQKKAFSGSGNKSGDEKRLFAPPENFLTGKKGFL